MVTLCEEVRLLPEGDQRRPATHAVGIVLYGDNKGNNRLDSPELRRYAPLTSAGRPRASARLPAAAISLSLGLGLLFLAPRVLEAAAISPRAA